LEPALIEDDQLKSQIQALRGTGEISVLKSELTRLEAENQTATLRAQQLEAEHDSLLKDKDPLMTQIGDLKKLLNGSLAKRDRGQIDLLRAEQTRRVGVSAAGR
jgi:chromosome segregation ATPase